MPINLYINIVFVCYVLRIVFNEDSFSSPKSVDLVLLKIINHSAYNFNTTRCLLHKIRYKQSS